MRAARRILAGLLEEHGRPRLAPATSEAGAAMRVEEDDAAS